MSVCAGLAALADEELAMVLDGRYDELESLTERRELLLTALHGHAVTDAADRAALVHAQRVLLLAGEALRQRLTETAAELAANGHRRRAVRGYLNSTNV